MKIGKQGKLIIKMGFGAVFLVIITILPSSAQENAEIPICWQKFMYCLNYSLDNLTPEIKNGSISTTEYLCCSLLENEWNTENQCFCSLDSDTRRTSKMPYIFSQCGFPTFEVLCPQVVPPSISPQASSPDSEHLSPPVNSGVDSVPESHSGTSTIVIAVVVVTLVVLLVVFGMWLFCRQARKKSNVENSENGLNTHELPNIAAQDPPQHPPNADVGQSAQTRDISEHILRAGSLQYDFQTLEAATNTFSQDHMIGRGGFGLVYKGTLANGQDIAVKRLSDNSGQGDKEFKSEVELLTKLRHRNLVSLLGCCLSGAEMLLVYEFVENKSLDNFLFDSLKKEQLNWSMRYNIIKGTAKGMLYLHEDSPTRIIHRDLKAANVLLDGDMNPRIADFGLAKISNFEQTHISISRVAGTFGYMAPEYLMYGKMSVKSDVYSFGALVLEIVSGRRIHASKNQSGVAENLLSYAWSCWEERTPLEMMDPTIKDTCSEEEVIKCITIGLLSIQEDFSKRPTMGKIVCMLDANSDTALPSIPQRPVFMSGVFGDETTTTETTSSNSSCAPWSYPNNSKYSKL